jgi:hypothetical protein
MPLPIASQISQYHNILDISPFRACSPGQLSLVVTRSALAPTRVRFLLSLTDLADLFRGWIRGLRAAPLPKIPVPFTVSAFWNSESRCPYARGEPGRAQRTGARAPRHRTRRWFSEEGRREGFAAADFGRATNREICCQEIDGRYRFSVFQSAWTRALVASSITISSGQGRVNPSVAHFRVASIPIFEP